MLLLLTGSGGRPMTKFRDALKNNFHTDANAAQIRKCCLILENKRQEAGSTTLTPPKVMEAMVSLGWRTELEKCCFCPLAGLNVNCFWFFCTSVTVLANMDQARFIVNALTWDVLSTAQVNASDRPGRTDQNFLTLTLNGWCEGACAEQVPLYRHSYNLSPV